MRAVVHLAAAIRDQHEATIEELNGLATARLLRYARVRGSRALRLLRRAGRDAKLPDAVLPRQGAGRAGRRRVVDRATVLSPSIVYDPGDPFMSLLRRLSLLPWMPISGSRARPYQPIWAEDAAECALHALRGGSPDGARRLELAGPEVLSYEEIVRLALTAWDRPRPLLHVPLWAVRRGLGLVERLSGAVGVRHLGGGRADGGSDDDARGTEDARRLGHAEADGAGAGARREPRRLAAAHSHG